MKKRKKKKERKKRRKKKIFQNRNQKIFKSKREGKKEIAHRSDKSAVWKEKEWFEKGSGFRRKKGLSTTRKKIKHKISILSKPERSSSKILPFLPGF